MILLFFLSNSASFTGKFNEDAIFHRISKKREKKGCHGNSIILTYTSLNCPIEILKFLKITFNMSFSTFSLGRSNNSSKSLHIIPPISFSVYFAELPPSYFLIHFVLSFEVFLHSICQI